LPGRPGFFLLKILQVQINSASSLKIVNEMVFYCSNNPKKQKNVLPPVYFSLGTLITWYTEVAFRKTCIEPQSRCLLTRIKGVIMEKNSEVIQTHPLVGWDISTVDSYDALMLRLHYQTPNQLNREEAEVGQTLWLTTDVARQFISILEAGIAKIESGDYQENEYKRH
jgi:biofilm regulator BssS